MLTLDAVILGGGVGNRFSSAGSSSAVPKQFQMLGDAPVFVHCLRALLAMDCFRQIVLAMPKDHIARTEELIDSYLVPQQKTVIRIVAGGDRRQDSSALALEAVEELSPVPTRVLIHDACRPYLSPAFLARVKNGLLDRSYGAWVPVVPLVDTIKKVENQQVVETVERGLMQRVQTPQVFEYTVIRSLAEKVKAFPELNFTDDASLCEYYGIPVGVFEGDVRNLKLTYEFELETLRSMLRESNQEPGPDSPRESERNDACAPESATTFTV